MLPLSRPEIVIGGNLGRISYVHRFVSWLAKLCVKEGGRSEEKR
jgi:hypothetical protein